jgi:hypothetical protein
MSSDTLVLALFLVTAVLAVVLGIVQFRKARRARQTGERSAAAEARHEPRAPS